MGRLAASLEVLKGELRRAKYDEGPLDADALLSGDPSAYLRLLHFALLRCSTDVARWLAELGYELYAKSDARFVECVWRLMRQELGYRHALSTKQFLSAGFAERKLQLTIESLRLVSAKHADLGRSARRPVGVDYKALAELAQPRTPNAETADARQPPLTVEASRTRAPRPAAAAAAAAASAAAEEAIAAAGRPSAPRSSADRRCTSDSTPRPLLRPPSAPTREAMREPQPPVHPQSQYCIFAATAGSPAAEWGAEPAEPAQSAGQSVCGGASLLAPPAAPPLGGEIAQPRFDSLSVYGAASGGSAAPEPLASPYLALPPSPSTLAPATTAQVEAAPLEELFLSDARPPEASHAEPAEKGRLGVARDAWLAEPAQPTALAALPHPAGESHTFPAPELQAASRDEPSCHQLAQLERIVGGACRAVESLVQHSDASFARIGARLTLLEGRVKLIEAYLPAAAAAPAPAPAAAAAAAAGGGVIPPVCKSGAESAVSADSSAAIEDSAAKEGPGECDKAATSPRSCKPLAVRVCSPAVKLETRPTEAFISEFERRLDHTRALLAHLDEAEDGAAGT